jgi:hypothetical protein
MNNKLTENSILEQENKLYRAIKDGDVTALDHLLHDNLLFILPSGETITKEIDLNTYRDGALKVDELLPETENLNIIDDMAVITLTMKLKGKFNEVPFEAGYRYIRFWKKFDDGIKVVGGSGMAI